MKNAWQTIILQDYIMLNYKSRGAFIIFSGPSSMLQVARDFHEVFNFQF